MSKWKIVPVEATAEMVEADIDSAQATTKAAMLGHKIPFVEGLQRCYSAMLAAAPPYVVTDEDVEAIHSAFNKAYWDEGNTISTHAVMRAALEAFVRRLGGES